MENMLLVSIKTKGLVTKRDSHHPSESNSLYFVRKPVTNCDMMMQDVH
jgi:hypothetical protein